MNNMILSKYPNDNLILGETTCVNDRNYYTTIKNKKCLIKGRVHPDMPTSMYVDIIDRFMAIKCRHIECYGKTYPCQHIMMTNNEFNLTLNGNVNITIQGNQNDEIHEFPKFEIFDDEELNNIVYNGLKGTSVSHAIIMYYHYKNDFIYAENNEWYGLKRHKWVPLGIKNTKLRIAIHKKLEEIYEQVFKYYKENGVEKKKLNIVRHLINSLEGTVVKNYIMTELTDLFVDAKNPNKNFLSKLDTNKFLIGFDNGVYDLKNFVFREGNNDDYISMSVNYDYKNEHTDKYNDLLTFLSDIQPNEEERNYMLTYLSIALIGNELELFTILTGKGRNGKSKFVELLQKTFGDYFECVQAQLFTRPRPDASSPDPGVLNLQKKKLVIASEPERNGKLNNSFIKFITGRDSATLRMCHSNEMVKFSPTFITLLICNDIPDCDSIDYAFSKRLRCINFPTEFVDNPERKKQKKMIVDISKFFDDWKLDLMLLLIEKYKNYSATKMLKTTKNILKWTLKYQEEINPFLQFLNEKTVEANTNIHCTKLYEHFKIYYKNNIPNAKIPSNKEFINNIRKHKNVKKIAINRITLLGVNNLKLIDEDSDDEDSEDDISHDGTNDFDE